MSNETPPPIQAPTAKEKKYDRQLRLWAASGQRALEESHVLLIIPEGTSGSTSSVAGSETLKNLILPSIGQFTVLDSAKVSEPDLGINFFLEASSVGKSRADESKRLLEELNPDVQGYSRSETVEQFLQDANCLEPYSHIILCGPASHSVLKSLSQLAWKQEKPLIYVQSIGFYSSFSIQIPSDFPIVDTHPDPDSTQDIRMLAPWPGLLAEVEQLGDITKMSDDDHGHIPYILLLLHYLEEWKASHGGKAPENFKEKTQFRDLVRDSARTDNAEGGEENYDEAVAAVLKSINPPSVSSSVREVFAADHCVNLTSNSSGFWYTAAAVKKFYEAHGVLPLPGALPDMKARSAHYIQLQNVYKNKARSDIKEVLSYVRKLEEEFGKSSVTPEAEVEAFCKNAAHIKVVSGTPIPLVEVNEKTAKGVLSNLENEESLVPILLAFNLVASGKGESTLTELLESLLKLNGKGGIVDAAAQQRVLDAYKELERAAGGELHNISSFTGGMVAQEVIKVITKQYIPVNNTCIFDGIKGKTEVLLL